MNKDLTVVLTIKGRHLHTLRWLWHANRIRLPFHVIVADGEVHPTIDRLISDPTTFPDLSYEYHRYEDRSLKDYYAKIADALAKVKTPYVMMSDNDDFLMPFGIGKTLAFLEAAPEYVCAGGGIPGFSLADRSHKIPGVAGSFGRISYRYISNGWYHCRDIDSPLASDRVLEEIRNPLAVHYNVYRTRERKEIADDVVAINPSLILCEMFGAMRTMTLGKVKSDPSYFIYFRQQASSQMLGYSKDLVDDILYSNLSEGFRQASAKITNEVSYIEEIDPQRLKDQVYSAYADQLRMRLVNTMLRYRFPRLFAVKQFLHGLPRPSLPARLQRRMALRKLWQRLAADGADHGTIAAHAAEMCAIEKTLQGDDFSRFVINKSSELVAESTSKQSQ